MNKERAEKIKDLWKKIHGDFVPTFYWQFHPDMFYWYNEEMDCIECDCGLQMPIKFIGEELNERNLRQLIRDIRNKIYSDYKKIGWELDIYPS